MKQTRQLVRAVKQSIYLDVYVLDKEKNVLLVLHQLHILLLQNSQNLPAVISHSLHNGRKSIWIKHQGVIRHKKH